MLTQSRRLRTGRTIWARERRGPLHVEKLRRDVRTEVAIVGAGISGALLAESLSGIGLQVVLLDRRSPVSGSTPASTCLIQCDLDTPLTHLRRRLGAEPAYRIWSRTALALTALKDRVRSLQLDVDLADRDSLYLSGDVLDADALEEEGVARRRVGLDSVLLSRGELKRRYGFERAAALLSTGQMVADPVKLATELLRVSLDRGTKLFSPVQVERVEPHRRGAVLHTRAGPAIDAQHVVFATGYEMPKQVPAPKHSIASTWAIATRPQRRALWPTECLVWEAADPYLYLRTTPDGRIICGGLDESFADEDARDALLEQKTRELEKKLKALWPSCDPHAAYRWTGNFGTSTTGTPSIGHVPGVAHCYAVMGYGGNGITFSMLAAQLLRNLLTGDGDRDAELFALIPRHQR